MRHVWRDRLITLGICVVLIFSTTVRQASAATYAFRMVNGTAVYSPILGNLQFAWAHLYRASPWVTALSIGVTVAKIVIEGSGAPSGGLPITTRGLADGNRTPVDPGLQQAPAPTFSYGGAGSSYCQSTGTTPQYFSGQSGQTVCSNVAAWATSCAYLYGGVPAVFTGTHVDNSQGGGGAGGYCNLAAVPTQGSTTINLGRTCPSGWTLSGNVCTGGTLSPLTGGTKEWAPRAVYQPDGSVDMGWERPTDPNAPANSSSWTPSDKFEWEADPLAPANSPKPETTVTPRPDGGYTIQTWSPNYVTQGGTTIQNGWTVQTMTVNNAGQVTNSTIITNNTTGPSAPTAPIADGSKDPAVPVECGSLSCEATQKSIETEIKAAGAPVLPDQAAVIAAAKSADKGLSDNAVQQITSDHTGDQSKWFSWAFTPPAGSCSAPTASLSSGATASFDFCWMVDHIRTFLAWVFAVFASWHVYGVLFRRGD